MAEINFGISSYSRHAPGVPLEERIMKIPDEGALEPLNKLDMGSMFGQAGAGEGCIFRDDYIPKTRDYLLPHKVSPEKFIMQSDPKVKAVRFDLASDLVDQYDMYILWIDERKEWVAVEHRSFEESTMNIDESETGPSALDYYCKTMLAEAYGLVSSQNVLLASAYTKALPWLKLKKDISRISPSELEEMAKNMRKK